MSSFSKGISSSSQMNNLTICSSKGFNFNTNSNEKTVLDREENIIPKYRDIPVLKTYSNTQSPVRYYENVSCVREIKSGKDGKSCIFDDGLESKVSRTSNKKRSKPDSVVHVNPLQFKLRSNLSFFDRIGQGSVSEPTLCNAKDRGDSITLQDICTENAFHSSNKYSNAAKYGSLKDREIKGCIYVKSGGKLIKSVIETKAIQIEDGTFCGLPRMKNRNEVSLHLGDSPAKSDFLGFTSKGCQNLKDKPDDFEVAIFLSGIGNISEKNFKKQKVLTSRKKKSESRFKQDKKVKKKKKKNDAAFVLGKRFAAIRGSYKDSCNMVTVSHYDSGKNFSCDEKQPSRWLPEFSSESGSEVAYDVQNKMKKMRRPKIFLENTSVVRLHTSVGNRNRSARESHPSGEKSFTMNRSDVMSEPSLFRLSGEFKMPKSKIRDHVLWEKFERIFRK